MPPRVSPDILYDADSILRLVDAAVERTGGVQASAPSSEGADCEPARPDGSGHAADTMNENLAARLQVLSHSLAFGYESLLGILGTLRVGRGTIESVTAEKLQQAYAKLQKVTDTTETAATDVLVGLEDTIALVDELDALDLSSDRERAAAVRGDMRNKLFDLMTHLQFQDITRQQLDYASALLRHTEQQLALIAATIEPTAASTAGAPADHPGSGTCDPQATVTGAALRQAVADQVVASRRSDGRTSGSQAM